MRRIHSRLEAKIVTISDARTASASTRQKFAILWTTAVTEVMKIPPRHVKDTQGAISKMFWICVGTLWTINGWFCTMKHLHPTQVPHTITPRSTSMVCWTFCAKIRENFSAQKLARIKEDHELRVTWTTFSIYHFLPLIRIFRKYILCN